MIITLLEATKPIICMHLKTGPGISETRFIMLRLWEKKKVLERLGLTVLTEVYYTKGSQKIVENSTNKSECRQAITSVGNFEANCLLIENIILIVTKSLIWNQMTAYFSALSNFPDNLHVSPNCHHPYPDDQVANHEAHSVPPDQPDNHFNQNHPDNHYSDLRPSWWPS